MTSLFFPTAQWEKILALQHQNTRKAKVFRALLSGNWIPGQYLVDCGGGYDARTRCSRLIDIGVPVEARSCDYSTLYERRIPSHFIQEYEYRKRRVA